MPTLTITKTYDDGQILNETDLDNIKSSIETFVNTTKLDADNLALDTITSGLTSTQANNIAAAMTVTGAIAIVNDLDSTHAIPTGAANRIFNLVDSTHAIPTAAANRIVNLLDSIHSIPAGAANVVFNQASSTHTIAAATANRIFNRVDSVHSIATAAANRLLNLTDSTHSIPTASANRLWAQSEITDYDQGGSDPGDVALTGSFADVRTLTTPSTGTYLIIASVEINIAVSSTSETRIYDNALGAAISETYLNSTGINDARRQTVCMVGVSSLNAADSIKLQARATAGSGFYNASDFVMIRIA